MPGAKIATNENSALPETASISASPNMRRTWARSPRPQNWAEKIAAPLPTPNRNKVIKKEDLSGQPHGRHRRLAQLADHQHIDGVQSVHDQLLGGDRYRQPQHRAIEVMIAEKWNLAYGSYCTVSHTPIV